MHDPKRKLNRSRRWAAWLVMGALAVAAADAQPPQPSPEEAQRQLELMIANTYETTEKRWTDEHGAKLEAATGEELEALIREKHAFVLEQLDPESKTGPLKSAITTLSAKFLQQELQDRTGAGGQAGAPEAGGPSELQRQANLLAKDTYVEAAYMAANQMADDARLDVMDRMRLQRIYQRFWHRCEEELPRLAQPVDQQMMLMSLIRSRDAEIERSLSADGAAKMRTAPAR